MKYEVITKLNSMSYLDNVGKEEETQAKHLQEMDELADIYTLKFYLFHSETTRFNRPYYGSLESFFEYLPIKDGVDLVKFENGNIGFVAYNGEKETYLWWEEITEEIYDEMIL